MLLASTQYKLSPLVSWSVTSAHGEEQPNHAPVHQNALQDPHTITSEHCRERETVTLFTELVSHDCDTWFPMLWAFSAPFLALQYQRVPAPTSSDADQGKPQPDFQSHTSLVTLPSRAWRELSRACLGHLPIGKVTECPSVHTNVIETTNGGDSNGKPAEGKKCSAPHLLTRQDNALQDPHKIAL